MSAAARAGSLPLLALAVFPALVHTFHSPLPFTLSSAGTNRCLLSGARARCGVRALGMAPLRRSSSSERKGGKGLDPADLPTFDELPRGRIGSAGIGVQQTKTLFLVEELTTDDGLSLSGQTLRNARSDWVLDIMSTGGSLVLDRIAGRLSVVTMWAAVVAGFFTLAPKEWEVFSAFNVPGWPHELVGGFLAILLVFRTDQAYQRFWEGREQWATMSSEIRSMTRAAVTFLDEEQLDVALAHLSAFPVALKQHLRGERDLAQIREVFESFEVTSLLDSRSDQGYDVAGAVTGSSNMPLSVLTSFSCALRPLSGSQDRGVARALNRLEEGMDALAHVVSGCEKIKCTPIPLSYSRHTSRFFTLFAFTLPFSLVETASPYLVPAIVVGVSWILFATEEIGHVIEEPFGAGVAQEKFPPLSSLRIKEVFESMDEDSSGMLDETEMFLAMRRLGVPSPGMEVARILKEYDSNGDGMVDFEEFCEILADVESEANDQRNLFGSMDGEMVPMSPGRVLVEAIYGFYAVIGMVFKIDGGRGAKGSDPGRRVSQLEVLPLQRYCTSLRRDILQQVVFLAPAARRRHYVQMYSMLSDPDEGLI